MPNKQFKREVNGLDKYLRIFKKVQRNPNLTLLRKFILSDVISFTINGEKYYKTSAQLAKELGNYKAGTIQANFQWLNDKGYLDCQPIKMYDTTQFSLREARVVQIEQWINPDEYLAANSINIIPLEAKTNDHPLKTMWRNSGKRTSGNPQPKIAEPSTAARPNIPSDQPVRDTDILDDDDKSELTIGTPLAKSEREILRATESNETAGEINISCDIMNFSNNIRSSILNEIAQGTVPIYLNANIVFDESTQYKTQVVRIFDKNNPPAIYTTRNFIETGIAT